MAAASSCWVMWSTLPAGQPRNGSMWAVVVADVPSAHEWRVAFASVTYLAVGHAANLLRADYSAWQLMDQPVRVPPTTLAASNGAASSRAASDRGTHESC